MNYVAGTIGTHEPPTDGPITCLRCKSTWDDEEFDECPGCKEERESKEETNNNNDENK